MRNAEVASVMTTDVVRAGYGTPFKAVARLLAEHRIGGLPVVDEHDHVIGVVSETDLMTRQGETPVFHRPARRAGLPALTPGARRRAVRARARTAGQLMTAPPVTAHAGDTVVQAARTMARRHVQRLPVLDAGGRLVGIVTRHDLMRIFLRPDAEIRREVIDEILVKALWLPPRSVDVFVTEGVVTLDGRMERRSETEIAVAMARRTDGAVGVVDRLTYRMDDTRPRPDTRVPHGAADGRPRRI
ncbi:CBS domain-containing protein [Streptomyces sp. NPDC048737]|uniref:CBS domain-containing protein n=1 Tax=unclassified Streptomyces TaxID=2593676 RepID=UPI00341C6AEF